MKANPTVSVLTPSLNQARWLPTALESVRNQDYESVEHIVVDGASTDDTLAILEQSTGVRWISEPDGGQSEALNKALGLSNGEIIGWVNADDGYFDVRAISAAVNAFAEHPYVDIVYGHGVLVDQDNMVLHAIRAPRFSKRLLRLHDFIVQPSAFVRRTALSDGFVDVDLHYVLDYELWQRLSRRYRFRRIDRLIAIDRHHLNRKVVRHADAAAAEERGLRAAAGGSAYGLLTRVARKSWTVSNRIRGVSLLRSLLTTKTAANFRVPSVGALYRSQLLTTRKRLDLTGTDRMQ